MVYSPRLGEVAEEIAAAGIPVVDDLAGLPAVPDVIHGHHHLETIQAIQHFPKTPAIFVCHDSMAWHDEPPKHPNILRLVAVDENCRERLARDWPRMSDRIEVIQNGADLNRFVARPPLPPIPRRALIFSNNAGENSQRGAIEEACERMGIPVDVTGSAAGTAARSPESALPRYDLVFAKARCALEAMAVGSAVVLCDAEGLGGMVTSEEVALGRRWNFGRRLLTRPLETGLIAREIQRYDANDAGRVSRWIRDHAALENTVDRYVTLYEQILGERIPWGLWYRLRDGYPRTERVEARDQAGISVEVLEPPTSAWCGQLLRLSAKLSNDSSVALATSPPWPVLLAHRWSEGDEDSGRHILQPPLWPGSTRDYEMQVTAPMVPGEYVLQVRLLQEGWRWLDQVDPPVTAELPIRVVAGSQDGSECD